MSSLTFRYSGFSDLGLVRKENQDSGYAGPNLLAIADGVGGSARGDIASSVAINVIRGLDRTQTESNDLKSAILTAHQKISEIAVEDPALADTSTTLTVATLVADRLLLAHIGDSRAYLLRAGKLSQLTTDHTFVQTLVDDGKITAEQARTHPNRNLILRALDGTHEPQPDLFEIEIQHGDRIMLCSDGVLSLTDPQILTNLQIPTTDSAVIGLVQSALAAGSSDNVSVVIGDIIGLDELKNTEETAAIAIGPMVIGAAAEIPRKSGAWTKRRKDFRPKKKLDAETLRYAPRSPDRFWLAKRAFMAGILLLLLAGLAKLGYDWTQKQFYVGVDQNKVAIYQGVELELPLVKMHHVYELTNISVADLPEYHRTKVIQGIPADNYENAKSIEAGLLRAVLCEKPKPPKICATNSAVTLTSQISKSKSD